MTERVVEVLDDDSAEPAVWVDYDQTDGSVTLGVEGRVEVMTVALGPLAVTVLIDGLREADRLRSAR